MINLYVFVLRLAGILPSLTFYHLTIFTEKHIKGQRISSNNKEVAVMKKLVLVVFILLLIFASESFAGSKGGYRPSSGSKSTYVKGYSKKDGTYVQPHYKTKPNTTKLDNYGTKGNTNPYTGKEGTKDPFK